MDCTGPDAQPLQQHLRRARYSDAALQMLKDFLADGYRLQVEQAARIRNMSDAHRKPVQD